MTRTRILLKNTKTNQYLARGGAWTDKPEAAVAFLDEIRAKDYSIYHRLPNTEVVVVAESVAAKAPAPTPVSANMKSRPEEAMAKTTKGKNPIPKPAPTKAGKAQSAEKKPLLDSMPEVTAKQPATTPTESPLGKTPVPAELVTVIEAKMNVGFGNSLFIRGQGAGLSWDKGQPLECANETTWTWSTREAKDKMVFKLVLNDLVWSAGEDMVVEAGKRIEIVPRF